MKKILLACALAPLLLTACGDDEDELLPKVDAGEVAYTQCPDDRHPHAIDLGLPSGTKWACCNIGSKKETDYGYYFAWGDPQIKNSFIWSTYSHYKVGADHVPVLANLGEDIQGTENDIAKNLWKHSWQMPTLEQIQELRSNCRIEWVKREVAEGVSVKGMLLTGRNGATIFLPPTGYKETSADIDYLRDDGSLGYYWTSNASPTSNDLATALRVSSIYKIEFLDSRRCTGYAIRPVRK